MKKSIQVFLVSQFIFIGCNNFHNNNNQEPKQNSSISSSRILNENPKMKIYYGNWVGDFIAQKINAEHKAFSSLNKLNLIITAITKDQKVYGQSVVAGNVRPFEGSINTINTGYELILNESGDDAHDGIFKCKLLTSEDSIVGIWDAYKKEVSVTERSYSLSHRIFAYNSELMIPRDTEESDYDSPIDWTKGKNQIMYDTLDDGSIEKYVQTLFRSASDAVFTINGSTQLLNEKQLKNLRKLDLEIIRNTIYARHGYTFGNRNVRFFFDTVDWYIPISNNVENELTDLEKKNITLLKRFEKYATDHYDVFGR